MALNVTNTESKREREKKHKNIILKHQKAHEKNTLETYIGGIYCL